jgi:hypothetical protein
MDKTRITHDTSLYRDPTTGRWLQIDGSRLGLLDEIDASVAGESARDRATRRVALTETLVPLDLLIQMPPAELRALELLLDVLTSSRTCRVTSEKGGRILCRINPFADVELLVEYMIRVRLGIPWNDDYETRRFWPSRYDRHLRIYMIRCGGMFDGESIEVCMVNMTLHLGFPVTDAIVSWALWANCGFPNPPRSFVEAYNQLTGRALNGVFASEEGYEEYEYGFQLPGYMTDENGMEPFYELDWQAIQWEESLMSSTRARRNHSRTCNVSVGSG